mgnify:FL=1|tara:strand:- start:56 stop:511 length:456 start_codon:yes stop_codon:yes gene_type:complete
MIPRFFERHSFILGLCSFAILIFGLFHFESTVAQKRLLAMQIGQYQPGDQVEFMRATVSGSTEEGMLILEDIAGAKIVTDLKDNSFQSGKLVMLKGKIDESQLFKVDTIEAYPNITIKIALSLLATIVLFWKLLGRIKISTQGLFFPPQNT